MPKKKIVKKCENDKFYTKPDVAEMCLSFTKFTMGKTFNTLEWVEPSAGNGAFSSLLECNAYDILPEKDGILEQDWFKYKHKGSGSWGVIGNPPFGSRNSLSKKFIKHSIEEGCSVICFVLPKVYQKYTLQKVFPLNWKLIGEMELPHKSFTLEGEDYHVPCTFQIWVESSLSSKSCLRSVKGTEYCEDFAFTKKGVGELFMFGASPTKLIPSESVKENNRGYYLTSNISNDNLLHKIKQIEWKSRGKSSVNGGVSWFTKSEIIEIYKEKYYGSEQ